MLTKNRTPEHDCLLCDSEKAAKRNSHIAPKFIGKSILGNSGKAYVLDSSKPHLPPKPSQDSPKENFILCPNCEKYFAILETYVAENLWKRILNAKYNDCFSYKVSAEDIEYAECMKLSTYAFRLFAISIFWRCSISSIEPFTNFKINEEAVLKELLKSAIAKDSNTLFSNTMNNSVFDFPIVVMRADNNHDKTDNFLSALIVGEGTYCLILNEYLLIFSLTMNSFLATLGGLNNIGNNPLIIAKLKNSTWNNFKKTLNESAAKKSMENAKRMGRVPWGLKYDL